MHFDEASQVFVTLERMARRLNDIDVPYALVGGLALFKHGFRRFTEDVDLLVTPEGLAIIHERLVGLGYLPGFTGSKNLKDVDTGVKIEFLVTGGRGFALATFDRPNKCCDPATTADRRPCPSAMHGHRRCER